MSPRSPFLALLALLALVTPAAAGERVMVAGPDGFVMQADATDGVFEYFACQCSGPIRAMAADDRFLYTADALGLLLAFDVRNGALAGGSVPGIGQINALAAENGALFAGTETGLVVRLDALTGAALGSRQAPTSVRALLAHEGFVYAGGTDGAIYRAPAGGGDFTYFTCFCFATIRAIVVEAGDLVIVDEFGIAARASAETGALLTAFWVGPTNVMAATGGKLLLYYDGGSIPFADAQTGQPLPGGFHSPIAVDAMLVVPDAPQRRSSPVRASSRRP
jgi:hypothetical protein